MGIHIEVDLRRIQFVLAVARELHFGNAAARLNVTESYVSREVKKFESEQGYLFFQRNGNQRFVIGCLNNVFMRVSRRR
jgi:DNA-binding transcriptional LysR family regulator